MLLDSQLIAAHDRHDLAALVHLYTRAAEEAGSATARGFYLTHAYVFALECADPVAASLHARLRAEGREE